MKKHIFRLPIGDWSDDGHGECNYYHIESNHPVEVVREAHFKIKEATGVDIEQIANEYENNFISSNYSVIKYLKNKNIIPSHFFDRDDNGYYADPYSMAKLWLLLLQDAEPILQLNIVAADEFPMLPFYGYDEKKRHIGFVGYGTF